MSRSLGLVVVAVLSFSGCAGSDLGLDEVSLAERTDPGPDTDECVSRFPTVCQSNPVDEQRVCHETVQPDGFIRQNFGRIHCTALADCGGGAGDIHGYRLCTGIPGAGQLTPCGSTGMNGCAGCQVQATCH